MADTQTDTEPNYTPVPPGATKPGYVPPPAPTDTPSPMQTAPQPMSQEDIQKFIDQRNKSTDETLGRIQSLDDQRLKLASQPTPHPAAPKLQDIPKPPDTKPLNVFKEAQPALIFTTVMGAMMMKRHGLGAMSAATGFLDGWQKGDQERMDRERQKYNDNVEAIIKENDVQKSRYDAEWNNVHLSQADRAAKISAIGASIGDLQTVNAIKTGNLDFAYKLQQDRNNAAQKLYESQLRAGVIPGQEGGGQITDDALKFMVTQYLTTGDKSVLTNIGRGAQSARNLARFRNMIPDVAASLGMKPEDVSVKTAEFAGFQAATRAASVRGAQIGVAGEELTQFAGPALIASERVKRSDWVPVNKIEQDFQRYKSNPDLRELFNRNAGLITAYAQVISRAGVPTVTAQHRAEELLNVAESQEAYQRAVDTLISEADLAEKAPDIIRERLKDKFLGRKTETKTTPPPTKTDDGWGDVTVQ